MRREAMILTALLALAIPIPMAAQDPPFQYAACPIALPEDEVEGETIDCGYLTVPADYLEDDGSTIDLAVAIIRSSSDQPAPDPVVYLEGGPGGEPVADLESWLSSPILDDRDIIVFDQRGTGYSWPRLDCVEPDDPSVEAELESLAQCRTELEAQGIDLDDFDSLNSAADVEALRLALGYDQWNLLGVSYGTRLALTVLRHFPEGVRSVVLDGVYPPQVNTLEEQVSNDVAGVQKLFDACAADRGCDAVYPYLETDFWTSVTDLQAEPLLVPFVDDDGLEYDDPIDGFTYYRGVRDALNDHLVVAYLPALIDSVAYGEPRLLADLLDGALPPDTGYLRPRQAVAEPDGEAAGAYWSVECSEEIPFNDDDRALADALGAPESIRDDAAEDLALIVGSCEVWGVLPGFDFEVLAVESDVPALILSGQFDVATPAKWATLAAETLPNSYSYEIPGAGHGTIDAGDCPNQLITSFLDDPTTEPNAWCVAEMGPPEWVASGLDWRR